MFYGFIILERTTRIRSFNFIRLGLKAMFSRTSLSCSQVQLNKSTIGFLKKSKHEEGSKNPVKRRSNQENRAIAALLRPVCEILTTVVTGGLTRVRMFWQLIA